MSKNMSQFGGLAQRLRIVLKDGARKPNVLLGLAKACRYSNADFERAIGQLFLLGLVHWSGRGKTRLLALNATST